MFAIEDGPKDIFYRLRIRAGVFVTETPSGPVWASEGFLGSVLSCPLCLSVWVAIPFAIWLGNFTWYTLVLWLALTGLSSVIELIVHRD